MFKWFVSPKLTKTPVKSQLKKKIREKIIIFPSVLDFHIHIARLPEPFAVSDALLVRGYKAVIVFCSAQEWDTAPALLEKWSAAAAPCFGLHPMELAGVTGDEIKRLRALFEKYPSAYVGECGLDRLFPGYEPGGAQDAAFHMQAELALEFKRPLMIHCVGDYRRILDVLDVLRFSQKNATAIFHRFRGDAEIVRRGLDLGAVFSIHSDSMRKASTRDALKLIPKNRLRFETDADESFVPMFFPGSTPSPSEVADKLVEELDKVRQPLG